MNQRRYIFKRILPALGLLIIVMGLYRCKVIEHFDAWNAYNKMLHGNINKAQIYANTNEIHKMLGYQNYLLGLNNYSDVPCDIVPHGLQGPMKIELNPLTYGMLSEKFDGILADGSGGHWMPKDCKARHKVAIIVPYRNRDVQLRLFLNHMHVFLQKQLIDYAIYIVEEDVDLLFNRALLMNIGYVEALKDYNWDCFVFHDVDLLPEDDRNLYYCPEIPRHLSASINIFNYRLPYEEIFGGVSIIKSDHFQLVNGYSNLYFGWGAEDDDMYERLQYHNLDICRYKNQYARYQMLFHKKDEPNAERHTLLETASKRFKTDGLNSLNYEIKTKQYKKLYTWLVASFDDKIKTEM